MIPATYRQLLAIPALRAPLIGSLIGRIPISGFSLAIVLLVREETGSLATAGAVLAAHALGAAVFLPVQGRLIDRLGQTRVLIVAGVASTTLFVALVLAAWSGSAPLTLGVIACSAGATIPPLSPCMRTLWGDLVPNPGLRQSAFALDAVLIEVGFITGPAIAAGVTAAVGPGEAVLLNAVLSATGTAILVASAASRNWRPSKVRADRSPLSSPGIRVILGSAVFIGFAVGAGEIAAIGFAADHGSAELAGVLISVQAAASLIGGLAYGSRVWNSQPGRRYPAVCALVGLGFLPMIVAPTLTAGLLLIALSGIALAPATAVEYFLVDDLAPAGTITEASTWLLTALVVGIAAGNAVSGAAVESSGAATGFTLAALAGMLSFVVAVAGRGRLTPPGRREQPFAPLNS